MKKSYYAIIPANVRYDDMLIPNAKLLYGEITALCNEKGYCWASNEYFAQQYNVGKSTIQRWLKTLEERGYITRDVKYKDNSNEIEARYIRIVSEGSSHKQGDPHLENRVTPHPKNEQDNTTVINNTFNKENSSKQVSSNTLEENFEKLWSLYPKKTGKKKALASYKRAIKKGITNKRIQTGIVKYKKYLSQNDWLQPADGSTWFNNERWDDEFQIENEQTAAKKYDNTDWEQQLKEEGMM